MLHMLRVHSQRGVACEANALQQLELDLRGNATCATSTFAERCGLRDYVWIQFHGALRERNAHITVYDVTAWSLVNPNWHS